MFAGAGMMAADGRCKTLDAAADGYVRGEAVVLIKLWYVPVPLSHLASFNLQELPLRARTSLVRFIVACSRRLPLCTHSSGPGRTRSSITAKI